MTGPGGGFVFGEKDWLPQNSQYRHGAGHFIASLGTIAIERNSEVAWYPGLMLGLLEKRVRMVPSL